MAEKLKQTGRRYYEQAKLHGGVHAIMEYKFHLLPIITNADAARDVAIAWQQWQSERDMYLSELGEWNEYFTKLAEKYGLTDEFTENGII